MKTLIVCEVSVRWDHGERVMLAKGAEKDAGKSSHMRNSGGQAVRQEGDVKYSVLVTTQHSTLTGQVKGNRFVFRIDQESTG
ncbi:MAG: hypothetical protein ACM3TN_03730 [Alphaproteobacteria bacterium]